MQRSNLSYEIMASNLGYIVSSVFNDWDALGITKAQLQLVYDNVPWNVEHRMQVERVLDGILYGELRRLGLPQMELPSEYLALVIATCVGPCNTKVACIWMADRRVIGRSSQDISAGEATTVAQTTWSELFNAIVQIRQNENTTAVRVDFANKMKLAVAKSTQATEPANAKRASA